MAESDNNTTATATATAMATTNKLDSENQSGSLELPVNQSEIAQFYEPTLKAKLTVEKPFVASMEDYWLHYQQSTQLPNEFWGKVRGWRGLGLC